MRKISKNQFANCESGNVSMIFALASLAALGVIGLAIDTSSANNVKTDLQAACDSVALAESISIYNGGELDNQAAKLLMMENFSLDPNALSLEMQDNNGQVTCNAKYPKKTIFGSIFGSDELNICLLYTSPSPRD